MSMKGYETKLNVARVSIYDLPRRVIFATGAVHEFVGPETQRLGGKKILVVTDKGVKKAGIADAVVEQLRSSGLDAEISESDFR